MLARKPGIMTKSEQQELAYALTELGDAMGCIKRKAYLPAYTRMERAAKRIRKLLGVEGEDEKA